MINLVRQQPKPLGKSNVDTGAGIDVNFFFGHKMATLQDIQKASFMGCLKMNIVVPPEGSIWGHFNDRVVNTAWVVTLARSFHHKIHNCENKFRMDIAVRRSWVKNIASAKKFEDVTGMQIADVPELELTATGKREIIDQDLWFMGGNHRRLALIWYVSLLKKELQILENQLSTEDVAMGRSSAPAISGVGAASTSGDTPMTTLQIRVRDLKLVIEESCMWTVGIYDRGAPIDLINHIYTI